MHISFSVYQILQLISKSIPVAISSSDIKLLEEIVRELAGVGGQNPLSTEDLCAARLS